MPGTNAGTGQPISLKCSQCRQRPDWRTNPGTGELARTGRRRPRRMSSGRRGHLRIGDVAYECVCLVCGHVGWYCHNDAAQKPLAEPMSTPSEAWINRVVDGDLVVSVSRGKRVRLIAKQASPLNQQGPKPMGDAYFYPGRLLSVVESKPYLEKINR